MPEVLKTVCTCDDFCDSPCPAHVKENYLQDRVLELETDVVALRHDLEVAEAKITKQKAVRLIDPFSLAGATGWQDMVLILFVAAVFMGGMILLSRC